MVVRFVCLVALLATCMAHSSSGQETQVTDWKAAFVPIEINNGNLSGPGKDLFLQACASKKYVLFGEAHGVEGVADFVAATHRALTDDHSYDLVLESGDWFTEQLSIGPARKVLERYPYSLAFDYNGDLRLITQAEGFAERVHPWVVGVDQESTAIHVFQFIAGNARTRAARRLARGLMLKALFRGGAYIRSDYFDDLEELKERVGEDVSTRRVIESLEDSMSIFTKHVGGEVQESVTQRESRMRDLFDVVLANTDDDAASAPRYLFKMGGAHTVRGVGPNGVKTLGQHVAESASQRGEDSIHIAIHGWKDVTQFPLPEGVRQSRFVYVDTLKLKQALTEPGSEDSRPELTEKLALKLDRNDAIILIPNASSASKSEIRQMQRAFVRQQLLSVSVLLIPVLMLIPVYWSCLRSWFRARSARSNASSHSLLRSLPIPISLVMLAMIALQFAITALVPNQASVSSRWFMVAWDVLCVGMLVIALVSVVMAYRNEWWTAAHRITHSVGVVACVLLGAFIYLWDVGGLLGV